MDHPFLIAAAVLLLSPNVLWAEPTAASPDRLGPGMPAENAAACSGGLAFDDGGAESGYGWVPSIDEGIYVQRFVVPGTAEAEVTEVCVCWLRTRADEDIDFDVVFYRDVDGVPEEVPAAVVAATATGVPAGIGGRFYEVGLPAGTWPVDEEAFYVGVRWSAHRDGFFFLCADRSPTSPTSELFFRDELSHGWTSAAEAADPIFAQHRAAMVRLGLVGLPTIQVPALSGWGTLAVTAALAGAALRRLRGRR